MDTHVTRLIAAAALTMLAAPALRSGDANRAITTVASTVPPNGDLNPYGVAVVPATMGRLQQGHILVSNFNNSANLQGTGTTIMDIAPEGTVQVFAHIDASTLPGQCPGGVGLTTALVALSSGWVVVGSLPTTDGTAATAQAGCLLLLNSAGTVVETIIDATLNGPWDMTALDQKTTASLFVSNVLNGTVAGNGNLVDQGTVIRINLAGLTTQMPFVQSITTIGSGFAERTDPAALVIGPTGLALSSSGTLYVADTLNNRVASIGNAVNRTSSAATGTTVLMGAGLNGPLGLAIRSMTGDLLAVNGANGLLVDFAPSGRVIASRFLDISGTPPGAGALFGLAPTASGLYFVDDATNTLNLLGAGGSGQ